MSKMAFKKTKNSTKKSKKPGSKGQEYVLGSWSARRWIERGPLLKAGHFSLVCEGKGGIMSRFAGLEVGKAGAACREFQLLIVSERVTGIQWRQMGMDAHRENKP